ncbi:MAG: methyl-accepting chemotaxis protein [Pseudomonadota bacterium]
MKRALNKIKRHRVVRRLLAFLRSSRTQAAISFLLFNLGVVAVILPDYTRTPLTDREMHILGIGLMLAGMLLTVKLARRIAKRVDKISHSALELMAGQALTCAYSHEPGPLGELARTINSLYYSGLRASRLQSGLDSVSAMVTISNLNGKIVYVNPALQRQFDDHAERVREQFPNVDPKNLIGSDVATFYSGLSELDDEAKAARKSNEIHTHEGVTHIGGRKLRVRLSPALAPDGTVIGNVGQWTDLTTEFEMETEIEHLVEMIQMGELDIKVRVEDKTHSYSRIAQGVNALTDFVGQALDDINALVSRMAQGDLSHKIEAEYFGRFGEIIENTNKMVLKFGETVDQIRSNADSLNTAIGTIRVSTDRLSGQFDETAQQLAQTSEATAKIAESVQETAGNARSAEEHAKTATDAAVSGAEVVQNAAATMNEIEASSRRVSDIIGVIDDIAFQTNLLALNAAVEAARAGDAGKGFTVVASEVRSLAQRASDSASDIKRLVDASTTDVRRGVEQAEQTGRALGEIQQAVENVAELINTITSATGHQEQDAAQIAHSLETMSSVTQQNNEMAASTAGSVRDIAALSDGLQEVIAFFSGDATLATMAEQNASMAGLADEAADDIPEWVESDLDAEFAWDVGVDESMASNG